MAINVVSLKDKLPNLELDINSTNDDSFTVMHWQCAGQVSKNSDDELVIANQKDFISHARQFICAAMQKNAALVLTPEYCFPWILLDEIIDNVTFRPQKGKLWCLAMQYIPLDTFNTWCVRRKPINLDKYAENSDPCPAVIFDGFDPPKRFANVLAYVFLDGSGRLVILLQSKLCHMGENTDMFEVPGLSIGKNVYLFDHGDRNSRALCSLICADAIERNHLSEIKTVVEERNLLMFHPQLNTNPYHNDILSPLGWFTGEGWNFLRLNWSAVSYVGGKPLNQLGSEYICGNNQDQETFWNIRTNRHGYQENRKEHMNLYFCPSRKSHWVFPQLEHVASYVIKQPVAPTTARSARHEFLMERIYFYNDGALVEVECPFSCFCHLVETLALPELLKEYSAAKNICNDAACIKPCPMLLWDRFAALCEGRFDHELLETERVDSAVNHCLTNLEFPQADERVKEKFGLLGQMANTLGDIVNISNTSSDEFIQILKNIVPEGVTLSIDTDFDYPQNKLSMFNIKGKNNNHMGLAVYSECASKNKRMHHLAELMKKTKAEDLNVILLYPDGDDSLRIHPNPQWAKATVIKPSSLGSSDPSFRGV